MIQNDSSFISIAVGSWRCQSQMWHCSSRYGTWYLVLYPGPGSAGVLGTEYVNVQPVVVVDNPSRNMLLGMNHYNAMQVPQKSNLGMTDAWNQFQHL